MKTYSKKRLSHITPIKIFSDDELDNVPEMKNSPSPRLTLSTPPPPDVGQHYDESLLARSPARSDASSSMKSRESALERRVSLLLRSDSPLGPQAAGPSKSPTPQHVSMYEPLPCALPVAPEEPEDEESPPADQGQDRRPQHKHFNSFAAIHFLSPKKAQDMTSDSPCKPKANKLTKRMSAAARASMTKRGSKTPDTCSPVPSSRSSPSIKTGIDAGLKALTRAGSTLIRKTSPLVNRVYRKDKGKGRFDDGREVRTADENSPKPDILVTGFAKSPASMCCESPSETGPTATLAAEAKVPQRPHTTQTLPLPSSEMPTDSQTSTLNEAALQMDRRPATASLNLDDLLKRGTTRLRLVPSVKPNGRRRLSVTEAMKPGLLEPLARPSTDSIASYAASSIASHAPEHELRRATGCVKRTAMLDPNNDCQSMTSVKRPKSAGKLLSIKRTRDDVFVDSPQPSPSTILSTAGGHGSRGPLQEVDANKKRSCDEGTLKTAKALKLHVSPKVKEVFNKFPRRRRSSNKPPKIAEAKVSRTSSKASRILGHHFSSKEPLRPMVGNENAIHGVREESMSDDELAH